MQHRHLNHQRYTPAAIDNIISSGKRDDWADLRQVALANHEILKKVAHICSTYTHDPYAQRYHFWMNYAKKHVA